jgi:hypothetical protein
VKIPIVKEYGSWAVFIFSCAAGIIAGLKTRPWQSGKSFSFELLVTVIGLVLMVNSKSPLSSAFRSKEKRKESLLWFIFFSAAGTLFLLVFLLDGYKTFLIFTPIIISYPILIYLGREHNIVTELNGFALLTLSAPIIYFVITGDTSVKLFIAVFIFFASGVFKVKARMKKTVFFKSLMLMYCVFVFLVYGLLDIHLVILIPLIENIFSMIWMREERLRTTGNVELVKGVVFTLLFGLYW